MVTMMLLPVAPLLQVMVPPQPLAVMMADSLVQMLVLSEASKRAAGGVPEVITMALEMPLIPQALLQVAV